MPYLKDISALLGLSVSTVSKALMDYPDVSDETRRMVLRTAEEINYKHRKRSHDWSGQNRRNQERGTGRSAGSIGVLVPDIGNLLGSAYCKEILCAMAVETACHNRDLVIIGWSIPDKGEDWRRKADEDKVIGICVLAGEDKQYRERYAELFDCGVPLVIIEQVISDAPEEIGRAAVRKLISISENSSVESPLEKFE